MGDQFVSKPYLSYFGPTIDANSLRLGGTCTGTVHANLTLTTVNGGDVVCFTGTDFLGGVTVTYTAPGLPVYPCTPTHVTPTSIACKTAEVLLLALFAVANDDA